MDANSLRNLMGRRSFLHLAGLGTLFLLAGCDTTNMFIATDTPQVTEPPCRVEAWWQRSYMSAADSVHNGTPIAGVAGRVYLFGADLTNATPLVGDGELVISLFDDTPKPDSKDPVLFNVCTVDAVTLKRLLRKDVIGWGYTVFVPWPEGKPLLQHLQVKLRFNQAGKAPLFSESGLLTMEAPNSEQPPQQPTHALTAKGH